MTSFSIHISTSTLTTSSATVRCGRTVAVLRVCTCICGDVEGVEGVSVSHVGGQRDAGGQGGDQVVLGARQRLGGGGGEGGLGRS